jgi:hypothetical protein
MEETDISALVYGDPSSLDPDWTPPEPPKERGQLETASASGDLDAVKSIFQSGLQTKLSTEEFPADQLLGALFTALTNDDYSIASYMLSQDCPFGIHHFVYVVEKKSYPFMQLFLDHGLDINTPINSATPPPLM